MKQENKSLLKNLFSQWESFLVVILCAIIIFGATMSPYFLNYNNIMNSMINFMDKGLMVYGIMMVLILGEIDISVASIITLSSCVAGVAVEKGWPVAAGVLIALGVGALCGAFNGFLLVTFKELNSTIVTLGSQILFRGLAYMLLEDNAMKTYAQGLKALAWNKVLGMPVILFAFIILTIVFYYVIHMTKFGRRLYAMGTNKTASFFSGIYTGRIKFLVFVVSGLCAGFAGLFLSAKLGSVRASIATGYEMEVITMAILGGTSPSGGRGRVGGVVLGVFIIGMIRYATGIANISSETLKIIIGCLLLVICAAPNLGHVISDFKEARRGKLSVSKV